jgi:two-component system, NarL family, response regulator NreC
MPIQVLLADDHTLVRQGLRVLLEREGFAVVAEASDGHEAVRLAGEHHPHVAVVDLVMPLLNGVDAVREIQRVSPETKTIILTMLSENQYILEALKSGAKGFVMKTHASEDLVQAIREAARGRTYLSPEVSQTVVQAYQDKVDLRPEPLSPRERQVLQLIAEGKSTKEVAAVLGISVKTAETHRTRIMEKLDIHETAGLVRYAIRRGLTQA